MPARYPERIVCLTEESVETLYLLGEQRRIVGISGFTVRPPVARKRFARIAAFTSANHERILELAPDLVVGFSDLQADIAAELIRRGVNVIVFNQRSVQQILDTVQTLASLVGQAARGEVLVRGFETHLADVRAGAERLPCRPRVYFEEWDEPMIPGIRWVSELIGIAGGEDCFAERATASLAQDRIIADAGEVIRRDPQLILGSWCGKRFRPERLAARPGWQAISAIESGAVHEIKSPLILQPGPAALSVGVAAIAGRIRDCAATLA